MEREVAPGISEGAARRAARLATPRMVRELETIAAMMRIHCADHHREHIVAGHTLCPQCEDLLEYARKRLAACPFGPDKPTCTNCQIHCYGPKQREAVRDVMRYAGPRMITRHPILAIRHVLDGRRPAPPKPRGRVQTEAGKTAAAAPPPREDTP